MGLFISNRLTDKQRAILVKYDYCGTWELTIEEAAVIIDELFEEERLAERDRHEPDMFGETMATQDDIY